MMSPNQQFLDNRRLLSPGAGVVLAFALVVGCSGRQAIPPGPAPVYETYEQPGAVGAESVAAEASGQSDPGTEAALDETPEERKEQPNAAADAGSD